MAKSKDTPLAISDGSKPRDPAIRVSLLPRDTNGYGTIFGGVMLSYIDQAGAVAAKRVTDHTIVTVSMKEVIFKKPVYVADLISFYACVTKIGRSSITTKVWVEAERSVLPRETVPVTEAEVVFVCIDKDGKTIPVQI